MFVLAERKWDTQKKCPVLKWKQPQIRSQGSSVSDFPEKSKGWSVVRQTGVYIELKNSDFQRNMEKS